MGIQEALVGLSKVIEANAKIVEKLAMEHGNDYGSGTRRDKMVASVEELNKAARDAVAAYTNLLKRIGIDKEGKLSIRLIRPDEVDVELETELEEEDGD